MQERSLKLTQEVSSFIASDSQVARLACSPKAHSLLLPLDQHRGSHGIGGHPTATNPKHPATLLQGSTGLSW